MQPTHRYLSNLTPLRGIAAIWVVVFHFSEIVTKFVSTDTSLILTKGYLMVDLFFILSGFIMTHVYQKSFQAGVKTGNFRQFLVARFGRIYPLHFFTLLVMVLFAFKAGIKSPVQDPAAISTNLLLIHSFGIHKIFTWNVPSWSISAEWWAYMVFPFLIVLMYRKKVLTMVLLGLFIILAYLGIMFWFPRVNFFDPGTPVRHNLDVTFDYGYLRGMAGFISGILLYKLYESGWLRQVFRKDITAVLVMLAAILSMHFGANDVFTVIFFAAIVFSFALNDEKLHKACNNGIAQYIGKISYSIYMVQMFIFIPVFMGVIKLPGLIYREHDAYTSFWNGAKFCLLFLI